MKRLCIALVLIIVWSSFANIACFAEETTSDYTVYDKVEFADDRVIVVLDNLTSMNFLDYSTELFNSVGCKQVRDLSVHVGDIIERVTNNIEQHVLYGVDLEEYNGIKLGDYNQILCLELINAGKGNVLKAIETISKMDGVMTVFPDYIITTMTSPNDSYFSD